MKINENKNKKYIKIKSQKNLKIKVKRNKKQRTTATCFGYCLQPSSGRTNIF
jgi:hypothetical protein